MIRIISFIRQITPDSKNLFGDAVAIIENGSKPEYLEIARTFPNQIKPRTADFWSNSYGVLALGTYHGEVVTHPKHGVCILLENGGLLPAALPNVNHGNRHQITEVFVHSSATDVWPGSAGCLTIKNSYWSSWISHFQVGEKVNVELKGL